MHYDSDTGFRLRRRRRARLFLLTLILVAAAFVGGGAFRIGPQPTIELGPEPKVIGRKTSAEIHVIEASRGLSRITVELIQNDQSELLIDERFTARPGWKLWGAQVAERTLQIELGKEARPALREGEATLRVVAERAPAWLRQGEPARLERTLPVRLVPPTLELISTQHYVAQGGAEAVIYRIGATAVRDGVEAGKWFFPGYPLPGGNAGDRFALFAAPYDLADPGAIRLLAADDAGNVRTATFIDQFFPQPPKSDTIELDERFLGKVVPEIMAATPDLVDRNDLVANYLQINRDLRLRNSEELHSLAARTRAEFLWQTPFLALPGGQVMSAFADRRSYRFGGREIDRQDHLGFDLASTARADVPASNRGVVVLARYFGIFGNCVVLDHGYGLMSLYAHLSAIAVQEGETVVRAQVIGRSGATGLAAGDHLHFSFLLHGLPVRPIEWWDTHWLTDRLKRKLGAALPFGG